jgi:hypothetical protein
MDNNTSNDIKLASYKPYFAVGKNIMIILDKEFAQKLGIKHS